MHRNIRLAGDGFEVHPRPRYPFSRSTLSILQKLPTFLRPLGSRFFSSIFVIRGCKQRLCSPVHIKLHGRQTFPWEYQGPVSIDIHVIGFATIGSYARSICWRDILLRTDFAPPQWEGRCIQASHPSSSVESVLLEGSDALCHEPILRMEIPT